ncbi:beta-ketoacyl synthase N-terminal-like domain-containing protein [Acinetobacter equi]|uniref:Beta-ketoacyl synthase n=1 Tax=Acinetobacter equi TaxID=1324350 RepID=A0A0N9VR04_9GAMM|nr:beta-ketoacyl synthase N-terminal-like domain-containing protein [Acinetobacter equi]ALH95778.1 beta-ketoacyl synthase [Acinetobacter equi]
MDHSAIISGYSSYLAFAESTEDLIQSLKQAKQVAQENWFKSESIAEKCGITGNKRVAKLKPNNKSMFEHICDQVQFSLNQAMLDEHCLAEENVRVYLTGLGPRVDVIDYSAFYDHNDIEDVTLTKPVQNLHMAKKSQDDLAYKIAKKFKLKYNPPNFQCTSNSSLSAVHLAIKAIESGDIDLVLIINCSLMTTQDIKFLANQSMLDSAIVQPFGEESKSVLFAEGYCSIILESEKHRINRGLNSGVCLTSNYAQISSGRGNDAAQLSASLVKVMTKALEQANVELDQLCAIIPHGNGSEVTDKAEAQAIMTLLPEQPLPVLAYKGQIGYTTTGSGIIDLIIGHYSLCHGELVSPTGTAEIREKFNQYVLLNKGTVKHDKHHLLKMGLGVDGSIIAIVMSNRDKFVGEGDEK